MNLGEIRIYLFKNKVQSILSKGQYLPSIMRGVITHACLECGDFKVWTDQTVNSVEGDVHVGRLFFSDVSCKKKTIPRLNEEIDVKALMKHNFNPIGRIIASAFWTAKRVFHPKKE